MYELGPGWRWNVAAFSLTLREDRAFPRLGEGCVLPRTVVSCLSGSVEKEASQSAARAFGANQSETFTTVVLETVSALFVTRVHLSVPIIDASVELRRH